MIVVTVQYVDAAGHAQYNGGLSVHFYNMNEALLFAENESENYPGTSTHAIAICKVYNDGAIFQVWQNGVDITG
jgi:translation elongation factor EF-Tu-like GTPase